MRPAGTGRPGHVAAVRQTMFDGLTPARQKAPGGAVRITGA